jgi:hypothetical protein
MRTLRGKKSSGRPQGAFTVVFVLGVCLLIPAFAQAAPASYVFNPTLSLVGACQAPGGLLDPVPDPGCPGGEHPPSGSFRGPSVATDFYGDIYVGNIVSSLAEKSKARIDIFSPEGSFITEVKDELGPQSIAVDSEGHLYVFDRIPGGERALKVYTPTMYEPKKDEIEYGSAPNILIDETSKQLFELGPEASIAVDPSSDDLWVDQGAYVAHFSSAKNGNELLKQEAIDINRSGGIAIDGIHKRIYLSEEDSITKKTIIRIFSLKAPYEELGVIDGSTTPKGKFLSSQPPPSLDVDDPSGHVFISDIPAANKVYEFAEDGTYIATFEHSFENVPAGEIAVDDGPFSPHPQQEGYLFVPSVPPPSIGHIYAFEPQEQCPPEIEESSVSNITETEATLHAKVNPCGLPTEYRLEYVTRQQFEEEAGKSFEEGNASIAAEGLLPKGAEGVPVSATGGGLEPGTPYLFRVIAENEEGSDEERKEFTTFPPPGPPPDCENAVLRVGASTPLPDCRAYELVTPPDTNGRPPGGGFAGAYSFPSLNSSPDGNRASFIIEGGLIPGNEGSGGFDGDRYTAIRGPDGWTSELAGPTGKEKNKPSPGSVSPDQTYALWTSEGAVFIHCPDGHSELVGRGSLGEDPLVNADLITKGAGHIVFATKASSAVKLEENAAPAGTATVYDRSAEGPTQVVSLLPGEEPQKSGQNASYLGASEEGEGIAFSIGGTIYLRLHNAKTFKVAGPGTTFAGVAAQGARVFYMEGGNLFAFDAEAGKEGEAIQFTTSGDAIPVNVASSGTRAYFVSPTALPSEPNPNGEEAKIGAENLYLSEEGTIRFVGVLTKLDVEGELLPNGRFGGLGQWIEGLEDAALAKDPSRVTPSGTTLLFESRADLAGFESKGLAQVYRYDAAEGRLDCLSCSPTGEPPTSNASLQSVSENQFSTQIGGAFMKIANQSPDGQRAFFQTAEPLVVRDTDGKLDVYEWEGEGTGSCEREKGCTYLISGGHSPSPDYLFAMSTSGDDVFFRTADLLLPRDAETTLSLYDARVEGGFPEPREARRCGSMDTCLLGPTPPPALPAAGHPSSEGNVVNAKPGHCPKGKRKVKRHGKVVCVKKRQGHRTGSGRRSGAK